ncbi:MAG: RND transporter [Sulfobacillus acidophilus]|uniref:RND transporter n=1 Tax=Sulfobacillus acidophilus TaxID=53633 RepID=A0A2T2WIR2_9FIRM|nr:MAG: RND transporter [Sulfobacillus acidophilus]
MRRKHLLISGATLAAALVAVGVLHSPKTEASSGNGMVASAVQVHTVAKYLSLSGTVASLNQVAVSYSGPSTTVSTIPVKVGQTVKSGQTLATLANGQTLTSPLKGTVVAVNLTDGDLVPGSTSTTTAAAPTAPSSPSGGFGFGRGAAAAPTESVAVGTSSSTTPLSIVVADTKEVTINASASQMVVGEIHDGETVTIQVPGEPGVQYRGQVTSVALASTSSSTPSYAITIDFTNLGKNPTPMLGMSADLSVLVKSQRGLSVPIAAVSQTALGYTVKLANGSNRVVHLGLIGLNQVVVTHGLKQGETILVPKASVTSTSHKVSVEVLPSFPEGGFGGFGGFGGGGDFGGGGFGGGF